MCIFLTVSALFIILIVYGVFIYWATRVSYKQIEELTKIGKEKWELDKAAIYKKHGIDTKL